MCESFKKIEGYSRYAVGNNGSVFDQKLGRYIKPIFKKGYYAISMVSDHGVRKNISRHRAVALAHIHNDDPVNKLHVNHLNGIKGDDRSENLEWSTISRNRQHAIDNNLAVVNKTVVVTDLCGEETLFSSIKRAALNLDISYSRLKRLLSDENIVVIGNNTIELLNDGNNNGKTKVLWRNLKTGDEGEFESIKVASEATGVSIHSIHNRLALPLHVVHRDGYQFVRKRDFKGWVIVDNFDTAYHKGSWEKSVVLRWLDDGEEITFDSQTALAAFLNLSMGKISSSLKSNGQPIVRHGDRFALIKRKSNLNVWRHVPDPLVEYSASLGQRPVSVTSVIDGQRQRFVNLKECSLAMGIGITTLHWRLNAPLKTYDGKLFEYINE